MKHLPAMVDMALTAEDKEASLPSAVVGRMKADQPIYPYGLCISLTEKELDKVGLGSDVDVGEMIHFFAMAKVTSKSEHQSDSGTCCRIELQIQQMSAENEDDENEKMDYDDVVKKEDSRRKKFYDGPRSDDY